MSDAKALRCSACDINWPPYPRYEACEFCGGETWDPGSLAKPLEKLVAAQMVEDFRAERARKKMLHEKFEAYCAEREATIHQLEEALACPTP